LYQHGKFVDEDFARWANNHNMEWYDANFYIGENVDSCSACCRYTPNFKEINEHKKNMQQDGLFINSIGGSALNVGSVRVNDLNLHHIANISKEYSVFKEKLKEYVIINLEILSVVRGVIKRNVEKGILKIYSYGLIDFNAQYNTAGIASFFECIKYFGGIDVDEFGNHKYNKHGEFVAEEILNIIKSTIEHFREIEKSDYLINIEQSPNESGAVKLARKDAIVFNSEYSIYGNQWIPLQEKCTLWDKAKISAKLDRMCSGGAISHINIENRFENEEQSWIMLNKLAKTGLIYFAYNTKISVCEDNHAFYGDICGCGKEKVDEYCRVVGFLTPVSSYSKERKIEYANRQWFEVE
jgi:ribonucleoside-triphosphate reductase